MKRFFSSPVVLSLVSCLSLALFTGCGSNPSDSDVVAATSTPTTTSASKGIAVDPYIEGAQFFQDQNDNGVFDSGEPESTVTGADGAFTFPNPVSGDHKILSKPGSFGNHLGKAFPFQLSSTVNYTDSSGQVIVSPMTSLVSQGLDVATLLSTVNTEFQNAGINVTFTETDLKADPLAGLDAINASTLSDDDFQRIRAVVALQQYLTTLKKISDPTATSYTYGISAADFTNTENLRLLNGLAQIVKHGCNIPFVRSSTTAIETGVSTAVTKANNDMAALNKSLSSEHSAKLNNVLQVKAVDVAKTCVSVAEYCSTKMVEKAQAGGVAAIDSSFITTLTDYTSNTLVKQLGPRYYFQRLKPILDAAAPPETVTGWVETPGDGNTYNIDQMIWSGIKTAVTLKDADGTTDIDGSFITGTWAGFEGIEVASDGTLSPR